MCRTVDTECEETVSSDKAIQLFTNDREALLVQRPNRFLIIAKDGKTNLTCHCPNPGRLIEFIFPGARLILEKRNSSTEEKEQGAISVSKAKTNWTVGGIYYHDGIVPLFAARANKAAEKIILGKLIPGLQKIQREYTVGDSRFDFLAIDAAGQRHLIEVKACSLVEYGIAMFPDAPSSRALKHLEELAALAQEGYCCHILFVIVHGNPSCFVPNLHTDPAFAAGLSKYGVAADENRIGDSVCKKVQIHAALLCCTRDGKAELAALHVPVDLSCGDLAEKNSGNYLILLEIPVHKDITIGSLGNVTFTAGWYVYTGSAQKNLSQRINRHLRKVRKQKHWHLDYLTPHARTISALPIMSYRNLECELALSLQNLHGEPVPGFGCSDCHCKSHLFYFAEPPLENRQFIQMLLLYRHTLKD